MNKIIEFFKKLFKINQPKMLEEAKEIKLKDQHQTFINSIKSTDNYHLERVPVTTLICEGDGLGIQKRISY